MILKRARLFVAAVCLLPAAALANDTELTYGGTPRPLNGNTTVSMVKEFVRMTVGEEWVTVDCRFTFRNDGPLRKVRMGFPDEGGEPGEDIDPKTGKPMPKMPSIRKFRSWVNGRLVKTTVIPEGDTGSFWHVKRVDFPANSTMEVRDRYTVEVGNSVAFDPSAVHLAKYVLHTGASWRGNIGRSEVEVVFTRKGMRSPLVARSLPALDSTDQHTRFARTMSVDKSTVYFSGPCKPTVEGKTLRFVRTNWRPTKKDDVFLLFDIKRRNAG